MIKVLYDVGFGETDLDSLTDEGVCELFDECMAYYDHVHMFDIDPSLEEFQRRINDVFAHSMEDILLDAEGEFDTD